MTAYGPGAGYDHLLLSEPKYRARIRGQAVFDRGPDPNAPFWALYEQFSFAEPKVYLDAFRARFAVEHVVVKIATGALAFRYAEAEKWRSLLTSAVSEASLLVSSRWWSGRGADGLRDREGFPG